jgi:hypothetical protein
MVCFSSPIKTKSTVYVSFCLSWTMVRGMRPLVCIPLMCENKRFHPTKAIYTLTTNHPKHQSWALNGVFLLNYQD